MSVSLIFGLVDSDSVLLDFAMPDKSSAKLLNYNIDTRNYLKSVYLEHNVP